MPTLGIVAAVSLTVLAICNHFRMSLYAFVNIYYLPCLPLPWCWRGFARRG